MKTARTIFAPAPWAPALHPGLGSGSGTDSMRGPMPVAGRRMPAGLGQETAPADAPSPCQGGNLATAAIVIALGGIAWIVFGK